MLTGGGRFIKVYMHYFGIESSFSSAGPRSNWRGFIVPGDVNDIHFNMAGGSGGKRKRKPRKEEPTSPYAQSTTYLLLFGYSLLHRGGTVLILNGNDKRITLRSSLLVLAFSRSMRDMYDLCESFAGRRARI